MASKSSTKKQQVQANKNAAAVGKASGVNISTSLSAITQTSVKIQSDLAKIGEELIQKHAELQAVDETIRLRKEEMSNLHGVDQVLLSIDEAKALHTQFVQEQDAHKDQIHKEHQELHNDLAQQRARAEEEFTYNLQLTRKAESDAWNETVRIRANTERDRKEAFEKDLANREEALRAKETEYQAALAKAATFEAELDKLVKKEVAIVTNSLTKDFKHQTEISVMQHQTSFQKLEHDNKRLVEALNNYETLNKDLQAQVKDAYQKNAELAAKAVEGASSKQAQAEALALVTNVGQGGNGTRPRS